MTASYAKVASYTKEEFQVRNFYFSCVYELAEEMRNERFDTLRLYK